MGSETNECSHFRSLDEHRAVGTSPSQRRWINMSALGANLNQHRQNGYRFARVLEQGGNTIMVSEWVGIAP